ncbi:MAG: helix-turn-helix transcriptional regulator [Deltaproteobacteria bacterium]|nr:helix-turn-helix transcriptional regulator [Deltaproteobacteria bacterium]MBW2399514.1 helix-turn-helix transcriptional regulator [Deltaproteobacteria bacterium]
MHDAEVMRTGFDLIRLIYATTVGEVHPQELADELSAALDNAGVVWLWLNSPNEPGVEPLIVAGADADTARHQGDALLDSIARSAESRRQAQLGFISVEAESGAPNLVHLTTAALSGGVALAVIAFRTRGEDDFSSDQRALVDRLAPHLDRSYETIRNLLELSQQNTALAEVMDRLPAGILLLDGGANVEFRNRAARRMLGRCDGFELVDGALSAVDPDSDEILQSLIDEVIAPSAEAAAGGALVVQRASDEAAYPVSVSRLLPGEALRDIVACVLVSDPDSGVEPAVELVRSIHNLTQAESDLVEHLARGQTLEEASRTRGVSINTMRSHLKRVFRKTGTSRQGELVQLVLRSFVPMAEE